MNDDISDKLRDRLWDSLYKYIYYIVALCVSCIAFSVYQTIDDSLVWSQIPLGIAIICWSLSIYCGLMFIRLGIQVLFQDVTNRTFGRGGMNPVTKLNPINKNLKNKHTTTTRYFRASEVLFGLGIISFLVWRIIEMM